MQFTKLRLLGFKSFVDPTELVIAPGLTGVVGPNGCGKSNLLEALRWVMGENRASAMRGGGMEDVIFAGAASRPARNYAEVTLHLDNADRLAPAGFNDSDSLEVIRRITRDAGSAYKTNGKDSRARDVQMLFADASTGAHSPALVRQGQISELINAKPKARRRILEEAAGISGLYQRRHEAELKLRGTETNLSRVDDVLEQLRSQLGALARQVKQAARYREIGTALRLAEGLLLYRRWSEAEAERAAAAAALTEATRLAAAAQGAALAADKARATASAALPPLREEETIAAAVLQRHLVERDALDDREKRARADIAQLTARIAQFTSDADRERGLNRDAGERISALTWEAKAIAEASVGQEDAVAGADTAARDAAAALKQAEAGFDRLTEDTARLAARHQSAARRQEEATGQANRAARELDEAAAAETRLAAERDAAAREAATARTALDAAQAEAARTDTALSDAEAARAAAQTEESTLRGALAEADGERTALAAEASALARMLDRERGAGTQLLDQITVAPGYEAALGAALGDDLRTGEIGDAAATGWRLIPANGPAAAQPAALPAAASALADHVKAPQVLAARLARIGLVDAADGPAAQADLSAGQRLVSRAGDLWRWDGYTCIAADTPSAAALRLQQQNRLAALNATLAEATARTDAARTAHGAARATLDTAQKAEAAARAARRQAEEAASQACAPPVAPRPPRPPSPVGSETVALAKTRRAEDLEAARTAIAEAEAAARDLGDLDAAAPRPRSRAPRSAPPVRRC